jgi:hypothetical protein
VLMSRKRCQNLWWRETGHGEKTDFVAATVIAKRRIA